MRLLACAPPSGAKAPTALAQELLACDLMLYPCDPVRFTEGFGVAVLEACAAGVVPVMTDADAFGEIYSGSGAVMVPRGIGAQWTDQFLETVLQLFDRREEIEQRRLQVQAFAVGDGWKTVVGQWDDMIQRRMALRG